MYSCCHVGFPLSSPKIAEAVRPLLYLLRPTACVPCLVHFRFRYCVVLWMYAWSLFCIVAAGDSSNFHVTRRVSRQNKPVTKKGKVSRYSYPFLSTATPRNQMRHRPVVLSSRHQQISTRLPRHRCANLWFCRCTLNCPRTASYTFACPPRHVESLVYAV